MKLMTAMTVLLVAALGAQVQAQSRAPLASPEDLEPAVDVGGPRIAVIDRDEAAAAAAAAANAPPADSSAAPSAPATPAPEAGPAVRDTVPSAVQGAAPAAARASGPVPAAPQAGTSRVLDTLDLGTTSITGNQELPKVLYIVPWKKSDLGELVGRPVNTLLDEVLTPVDPEVFERHLDYYETLNGKDLEE